jgi:membrane associated rhomboid family serine protease
VTLIVSFALNGWTVEPLDINPMIGPSAETLTKMGAKDSYLIVNDNEAWRLVSATILHAGLVHFFINMLALWFVGSAIEQCHGTIATSILFFLPATGGIILSAIFLPDYITVGASGGIFGLIGACLSDIVMNWKLLFCDFVTENGKKHLHVIVVVLLLFDIALNCVIGLTPYVDNFTRKSQKKSNANRQWEMRTEFFPTFLFDRLGWNDVWIPMRLVYYGTPVA